MPGKIPSLFNQAYLPSLDGLRFFAAMCVLFDHGGIPLHAGDGVTYFLVLSGFLFCWIFTREWKVHQKINLKKFYIRRLFRIMPAFYVAVGFTILAKYALKLPINFTHALSMVTYWGNYYNAFNGHPPTGFDLYWSLSLEEQFYLVWPFLFIFVYGRGPTTLIKFLVVSILGVMSWRSFAYLSLNFSDAYVYNAFDTRFDSLAIGCLLGVLVNLKQAKNLIHQLTRHYLYPIGTLLAIVSLNLVSEKIHYSIGLTLQSLLMGIFILQLVVLSYHPLWSWLNSKTMIFLGSLSFSIYLYHSWGLAVGYKFTFLPKILTVIIGAIVTTMMAYGSYRFIEKPFIELRKRIES